MRVSFAVYRAQRDAKAETEAVDERVDSFACVGVRAQSVHLRSTRNRSVLFLRSRFLTGRVERDQTRRTNREAGGINVARLVLEFFCRGRFVGCAWRARVCVLRGSF